MSETDPSEGTDLEARVRLLEARVASLERQLAELRGVLGWAHPYTLDVYRGWHEPRRPVVLSPEHQAAASAALESLAASAPAAAPPEPAPPGPLVLGYFRPGTHDPRPLSPQEYAAAIAALGQMCGPGEGGTGAPAARPSSDASPDDPA